MQRNLGKLLGKKLLPPNLPKVASSCLPIYLFSNSSENELEAMYFSCFTNRCSFIMASIMWKVPQYYWIVSAYTSNTFFFVIHSGSRYEYKDNICFRFLTENSTMNWPWHLWTLNIRVWKKYYENPLFWCSLQMRHSLVIFQQSTITTAVKL